MEAGAQLGDQQLGLRSHLPCFANIKKCPHFAKKVI